MAAARNGLAALVACALAGNVFVVRDAAAQPAPAPAPSTGPAGQPDNSTNAESPDNEAASAQEPRRFSLRGGLGLSEYYDSDPTGVPNGSADFVTRSQADLSLHDQTPRFQGDLAYSLSGYFHPNDRQLDAVENYLNAIGHAELYPEHVYLNARAFAQPTFISRLGSLDAGGSSTANDRNVYGYATSADFAWRFDDFARSEIVVGQTGEFFSNLSSTTIGNVLPFAGPSSANSTTVTARLSGGSYFERLEWVAIATGSDSSQTGFDQKQRSAEADLQYHLDHNFGIIADIGYRDYRSTPSLTRGLSGITAMGGFSFQPNDTFSAVFKAGTQYQFTSFTGNLRYQFTANSQFYLTLDDVVTTPQDRLQTGLNGLDSFQEGFYLPNMLLPNQATLPGLPANSGAPVNVAPLDGLALDNIISRYRTAGIGLIHYMERTSINLTGYGTVRDYLLPLPGFSSRQTVYGIDLAATRELNRSLTATAALDYSVAHEFGGVDKLGTISVSMGYAITAEWSADFRLSYVDRQARNSLPAGLGSLSDVQAGVGLHYTF